MSAHADEDPRWPRAAGWLSDSTQRLLGSGQRPGLVLLGVPAWRTSISPTGAHATPGAVRQALRRYSTWSTSAGLDLAELPVLDLGDVADPDSDAGEEATAAAVASYPDVPTVAIGGDNSVTVAVARGSGADGLVTLDAHHDLRDGRSNGSPVRRLVEGGLDGRRVVQVGICDFANSPAYARRAAALGISVVSRDQLDHQPMATVMSQALDHAAAGPAGRIHVDLDVDVCDRSVAPGCPASVPGGISASQLRAAARAAGSDPRVVSLDLTEVDATADAPDQRTVRLAALCVLEFAVGVALRGRA